MNWRRGLLLSVINLAVAAPMIMMMEARDQNEMLTAKEIMAKSAMKEPPKPPETERGQARTDQPEESVNFDPCTMWGVHYPVQVVVLQGADIPSVVLSGWGAVCPAHWSLAGRLRGTMTWPPTPLWTETQRKIDLGLSFFVVIQWFLIGAFPLGGTQKWWADPGAFITVCAVLAGSIAVIPVVNGVARLPALIAIFAWFWWLLLLIWKGVGLAWRSAKKLRSNTAAV